MDVEKSVSEPWIGVTRFTLLNKNPPEGYTRVQGRLKKKQVTTRPGNICQMNGQIMPEGSQRNAINKLDAVREQRGIYFILDDDLDYEEVANARRNLK